MIDAGVTKQTKTSKRRYLLIDTGTLEELINIQVAVSINGKVIGRTTHTRIHNIIENKMSYPFINLNLDITF